MKPQHTIVQGKSVSKADKELIEAILGGEMRNAWEPGDGIDQRGEDGPYSKRPVTKRKNSYRDNYDQIKWGTGMDFLNTSVEQLAALVKKNKIQLSQIPIGKRDVVADLVNRKAVVTPKEPTLTTEDIIAMTRKELMRLAKEKGLDIPPDVKRKRVSDLEYYIITMLGLGE